MCTPTRTAPSPWLSPSPWPSALALALILTLSRISMVVQVEGIDGSVLEVNVPHRALRYYVQWLTPIVLVWFLLQLFFTALTCAAQPMRFSLALYHVIITSTTIGLGDVPIDPDGKVQRWGSSACTEAAVGLERTRCAAAVGLDRTR